LALNGAPSGEALDPPAQASQTRFETFRKP